MSYRLSTSDRQFILQEMLELARYLTSQSAPPPTIKEAVGQLRDDLIKLLRSGSKDIDVDKTCYLPATADQETHP